MVNEFLEWQCFREISSNEVCTTCVHNPSDRQRIEACVKGARNHVVTGPFFYAQGIRRWQRRSQVDTRRVPLPSGPRSIFPGEKKSPIKAFFKDRQEGQDAIATWADGKGRIARCVP